MIHFSSISRAGILGRLLRWPLRLIPKSSLMPVWQGPMRGLRWVVGSATHGCWLGSYEAPKQQAMMRELASGAVFFDVGANVGFYTLLGARAVGAGGSVHAFEPAPDNLCFLRRHVRLNRLAQVTVHPVAVSDRPGILRFALTADRHTGHVSDQGDLEVNAVALDDLVAQGELSVPSLIKIDVEGAEFKVLEGARSLLQKHRPIVFLATHGEHVHRQCCDLLHSLGYGLEPLEVGPLEQTDEIIARPAAS